MKCPLSGQKLSHASLVTLQQHFFKKKKYSTFPHPPPHSPSSPSPPHQSLCSMEEFKNLDRDIEGSAKRWKKLVESECPEKEIFPQEWKNKTSLQRLCMMRALRPDRMTYAVR